LNFDKFAYSPRQNVKIRFLLVKFEINIFKENKPYQSNRQIVDFIQAKFQKSWFWADFPLCSNLTGTAS